MYWLHRIVGMVLCIQLTLSSISPSTAAEKRLAVIFANNAYPGELALQATHTDGANIRRALQKVGFDVRLVLDANKATMLDELRAFVQLLQAANAAKAPGDKVLAFFYFAGHGAQDTLYPGNYVWPTDAKATNSEQLSQSAIKLNDIIDWIAAGEPTSSFLVMDACRNYPFDAASKGVKKGFLAEERDVPATLIGYAAAPGATIVDSNDYSEALAAAIEMPAIDASRAFQEVQIRVSQKTQRQQHPSYYNRLLEIVHLRDGAATSYPIAGGPTAGRPGQTTMVTPRPVPPSEPQPDSQVQRQAPTEPLAPSTGPVATAQPPVSAIERGPRIALPPLKPGDAVITGFSGNTSGPDGKPTLDVDGRVLQVTDLTNSQAGTGSSGEPSRGAGPTARDIGQVYASAIDPDVVAPDIYLAATSIYGLYATRDGVPVQRGEPKAQWADGLFGTRNGGSPGTIWKISGSTRELTRFADITHAGNSNPGPGLGQLAFDRRTRQLFVSDLSTGLIHRIALSGRQLDSFDHGQLGRAAEKLSVAPASLPPRDVLSSSQFNSRDPATWGFVEPLRRIWGLAFNGNRLYYAVSEGPQIWSIAINPDGAFSTDVRLEADLADTAAARQELPRIEFDAAGNLYIGLLDGMTLLDTASPDRRPRRSTVVRLRPAPGSSQPRSQRWSPPEVVASPSANLQVGPGLALSYRVASDGRADLKACDGSLWLAGWRLQQAALWPQLLRADISSGGLTAAEPAPLGNRSAASSDRPVGNIIVLSQCLQAAALTTSQLPSSTQPAGVPLASAQGAATAIIERTQPGPAQGADGRPNDGRPATSPGQGTGVDAGRPGQGGGGPVATPRLAIDKQCASCALGGTCECRITLRNIGLVPINMPVGFRDPLPLGTDPVPRHMTATGFRTDGNDWRCSGVPGTLACTLPGASLPPLSTRTVTVAYAPDPPRAATGPSSSTCAVLQADEPISRAARQREACVKLDTDVVVTVTGERRCRFATRCSFEATINNLSRGAFLGSLSYIGELSIGGGSISRADIVAIEPTLPCGDKPGAIPFACSGRTELAGRETRKMKLTFRVPNAPANSGDARGRVCFIVAEGTAASRATSRTTLVELARTSAPANRSEGSGRSGIACIEFDALARCPGQLKFRGDQCACPDDQERHSGDQCQLIRTSTPPAPMPVEPPVVRPVPVPVLPPIIRPAPPAERVPDRVACERPRVLINGRCEYPMVDCYGKKLPSNQPCVAPRPPPKPQPQPQPKPKPPPPKPPPNPPAPKPCPMEKVCVQYGKAAKGALFGPCVRYEMRRQCPVNVR